MAKASVKCVAVEPDCEDHFVIIYQEAGKEHTSFYASFSPPGGLAERLKKHSKELKCLAFGPGGTWVLLHGHNKYHMCHDGTYEKMATFIEGERLKSRSLRWVTISPDTGDFVVLTDCNKGIYCSGGVPSTVKEVLKSAIDSGKRITAMTLGPNGTFACASESKVAWNGLSEGGSEKLKKNAKNISYMLKLDGERYVCCLNDGSAVWKGISKNMEYHVNKLAKDGDLSILPVGCNPEVLELTERYVSEDKGDGRWSPDRTQISTHRRGFGADGDQKLWWVPAIPEIPPGERMAGRSGWWKTRATFRVDDGVQLVYNRAFMEIPSSSFRDPAPQSIALDKTCPWLFVMASSGPDERSVHMYTMPKTSEENMYINSVDKFGAWFSFNRGPYTKGTPKRFHHSSLFGGKPQAGNPNVKVFAAGMIFKNSDTRYTVTPDTGHFGPSQTKKGDQFRTIMEKFFEAEVAKGHILDEDTFIIDE